MVVRNVISPMYIMERNVDIFVYSHVEIHTILDHTLCLLFIKPNIADPKRGHSILSSGFHAPNLRGAFPQLMSQSTLLEIIYVQWIRCWLYQAGLEMTSRVVIFAKVIGKTLTHQHGCCTSESWSQENEIHQQILKYSSFSLSKLWQEIWLFPCNFLLPRTIGTTEY